jgi:hypothetical protein
LWNDLACESSAFQSGDDGRIYPTAETSNWFEFAERHAGVQDCAVEVCPSIKIFFLAISLFRISHESGLSI